MREPAFSIEEPPAKRPIRQLLLIGSAALILAAINAQWLTGLPAAARARTAGVGLDEPPPWSDQEPGRVVSVAMGGPAARAGLRKGDRVQAINGIPNWSYYELHRLVDDRQAGDSLKYTVLRGTQTSVVPVRLEGRLGRIWVDLLCNACAAGIFFGVALFIYGKHTKDRRALTFFWMCLPFALIFSLRNIAVVKQGDLVDLTNLGWDGIITIALFFFLFPPLLHFTLIFPKPRPLLEKYPGILGWIYALPVLIVVLIVVPSLLTKWQQMNPSLGFIIFQALFEPAQNGTRLMTVALAIALVAAAGLLIWRCVRSARRKGWKSVLLSRPGLSIPALFLIPLMLGLVLVRLLATFTSPLVARALGLPAVAIILLIELAGLLLPQLIVPVTSCVSLFRNYRDAGIDEKQQLRWPLWGTITAVAGSFLLFVTLSVLKSLGPVSIPAGWLTTLFLLPIPVSFAFAIAKYRLMDSFPTVTTAGADAGIPQPELP